MSWGEGEPIRREFYYDGDEKVDEKISYYNRRIKKLENQIKEDTEEKDLLEKGLLWLKKHTGKTLHQARVDEKKK